MVVVAMAAVRIIPCVVAKLLVWDTSIINIVVAVDVLSIDMFADVEIIVLTVVVIALDFAVTVSHSADVVVGMLIDVLADVIIGVLSSIGVDVLTDVNVNIFAVVMTVLEFAVPASSEGFSR